MCEKSLSSTLTIDSVINALLLADRHNAADLKAKCLDYITSHSVEVRQTEAWKSLVKQNRADLMMELFATLADKLLPK